jgi:hypothetical protein
MRAGITELKANTLVRRAGGEASKLAKGLLVQALMPELLRHHMIFFGERSFG